MNGIRSVMINAPLAAVEDQTLEGYEVCKHPKFEVYLDKAGEFARDVRNEFAANDDVSSEDAEAVDAAREAEMAARKAGETDLSSYEEAVKAAQEALMAALQDAGIEMQEAHMERDNRNFGGRQQPRMNNEFNGQQPPEKPEGDLQPEVPSDTNE